MPETMIGVSLPGEQLACKLVDLVIEISQGMSAEQKRQLWDWIIRDIARWRKFWGMDDEENMKTLREILGLDDDEEPSA